MERFNYPNLKAAMNEDARILYLLECETWGRKRDEQEQLEAQQRELEQRGQ